MRLRTALGAAGVVLAVSSGATGALAQEPPVAYPAEIRGGSCASLGEVVAPLIALAIPEGDPQGHAGLNPVSQSITEAPLPLSDLLGASHAIAVHASPAETGSPIACGEIGGALGADGTLAIGLQAMNGAKVSGVSYFTPTADGAGTIVTVLLVDERGGGARGDDVDDGADAVDGADTAGDGANAADGVGNVTVGPAPDRASGGDSPDAAGTTTHGGQPGEDGAVDRPGRDSDSGRGGDGVSGGDGDRSGNGGDSGAARAGEDGRSSG
jgi:hypothetical protein